MDKKYLLQIQDVIDKMNERGGLENAEAALIVIKFNDKKKGDDGIGLFAGDRFEQINMIMTLIEKTAPAFGTSSVAFCKKLMQGFELKDDHLKKEDKK